MADKENLHKDHRTRLRNRYEREGLDGFEDHNALELLLFYAIPRKDTNPIAHRLLNRFGSLHAVFEASIDELCEIEGMGPASAAFLKMCPDISKRITSSKLESIPMKTPSILGQYFVNYLKDTPVETACVLFLDGDYGYVSVEQIQYGTLIRPRDVCVKTLELAEGINAKYAVLSHNHGNVGTIPSSADISATDAIHKGLEKMGIQLIGHFIVSGFDFDNFFENDYLRKEFRYDL